MSSSSSLNTTKSRRRLCLAHSSRTSQERAHYSSLRVMPLSEQSSVPTPTKKTTKKTKKKTKTLVVFMWCKERKKERKKEKRGSVFLESYRTLYLGYQIIFRVSRVMTRVFFLSSSVFQFALALSSIVSMMSALLFAETTTSCGHCRKSLRRRHAFTKRRRRRLCRKKDDFDDPHHRCCCLLLLLLQIKTALGF